MFCGTLPIRGKREREESREDETRIISATILSWLSWKLTPWCKLADACKRIEAGGWIWEIRPPAFWRLSGTPADDLQTGKKLQA
jgi:hypothetical protein